MAIEKYIGVTHSQLKELIDSLGWFAASEDDTENSKVLYYADAEKTKPVLVHTYNGDSPILYFSHNGTGSTDSNHYLSSPLYSDNLYVFKTRNGLLLSSQTAYASSYWYQYAVLLGKTNNGDVCVFMQTNQGYPNTGYTSAYGEAMRFSSPFQFRYSAATDFSYTSQIVTCPIPTAPSSGTSYIKNALALMVAPWNYYWGEVDIGGVRYVTNGYLAISDED